jgi:hypothetical protein
MVMPSDDDGWRWQAELEEQQQYEIHQREKHHGNPESGRVRKEAEGKSDQPCDF